MLGITQADKTPADVRPVAVNGTKVVHLEFAAVFDDQFMPAGQGEIETVGPQGQQPVVFAPGDVYVGKRAAAFAAAFPAAFQMADGVIQHHSAPAHPAACERDLEDWSFLVRVEFKSMDKISKLSRGKRFSGSGRPFSIEKSPGLVQSYYGFCPVTVSKWET
jgi:hypothetical protein